MKNNWSLAYPGVSMDLNVYGGDTFFVAEPDLGSTASDSEDAQRPRADGVNFGADYRRGRSITFELGVSNADTDEALDQVARLQTAWRADAIRTTAGAVATLTAHTPGRARVAYGRPRRLAPALNLPDSGYQTFVATFECTDDVFYSASEQVETITRAEGSQAINVVSDLKVWPVFTIHGPFPNPVIAITGGETLAIAGTVPSGQSVVLDTRPWRRTVKLGSTSWSGNLARTSRLARASLLPGTRTITISGSSGTGGSVDVAWRSSHPSL